jgi:hypothetical protein
LRLSFEMFVLENDAFAAKRLVPSKKLWKYKKVVYLYSTWIFTQWKLNQSITALTMHNSESNLRISRRVRRKLVLLWRTGIMI